MNLDQTTDKITPSTGTLNVAGGLLPTTPLGYSGGGTGLSTLGTSGQGLVSNGASIIWSSAISGFSGYSGISGYSGSGVSGFSGYSGSGISGFSGYSGINGATGTSGFSGYSGTNGTNGSTGTSGYSGYSGINGGTGSTGTSGYSGATGATGGTGATGTSGYSGYSGAITTSSNAQANSLGVGTAASGTTGEIRATNNVTAYYSDDRLKTKLGNIENALEKLRTLNGFYYEANEVAQALGYDVKREVGVSAQQVQAVLSEIVVPAPIDEQYWTVRYERLSALIIEAIKELADQVDEIKSKLN